MLDIHTPEDLIAAGRKMSEEVKRRRPNSAMAEGQMGFLVQEYVRGGREVIVGMTHTQVWTPVMFGFGRNLCGDLQRCRLSRAAHHLTSRRGR